ncbi:tumor necrosis factor receptor superfamily member 16 [Rhinatrema bivittatum]|uniref:tumor necrosis factor receptor superfamily member 16 n=1 Tax=Rhinatrema bivittatum TaxID=194408 RepID=UPI0011262919|nr:tumor necrosis factor receptor superfamily member 16 [Rhinatrema bivittatum]
MEGSLKAALPLPLLLLCAVSVWSAAEQCTTGQFTAKGECCKACGAGEGVSQPCGINQTVCESCIDSSTYSDTLSHTEPCKPCTVCSGLKRMVTPCVDTDDAECGCTYGYYLSKNSNECEPCRSCNLGFGMMLPCKNEQDTVCESCPPGTFSDMDNIIDPCMPCKFCEEGETLLEECTPVSDTICSIFQPKSTQQTPSLIGSDSPASFTKDPSDLDGLSSTITGMMVTIMGSSQPIVTRGIAENLIPIYCSILAAVVVGLVAFIVFKRWNSCKQNKPRANNRPVNQTPSPEGEKLHSDSGISVDSQSLHDQQPQTQPQMQALKGGTQLYTNLSPTKQEEVEKLLNGSMEDTWRNLAGELGYKDDFIDTFTQEECPVRALLSDWSSKDSATMDVLCSALRKIQREDIVESLYSESTATSPV